MNTKKMTMCFVFSIQSDFWKILLEKTKAKIFWQPAFGKLWEGLFNWPEGSGVINALQRDGGFYSHVICTVSPWLANVVGSALQINVRNTPGKTGNFHALLVSGVFSSVISGIGCHKLTNLNWRVSVVWVVVALGRNINVDPTLLKWEFVSPYS